MKKIIYLAGLIILATIGLILYGYFGGSKTADISSSSNPIFFYGRECPHCKIVEEYISQNNVKQRVSFVSGEVYHNDNNKKIFVEKFKACGLMDETKMGVPMLWDNGRCYTGQEDVINYFKSKMDAGQ
jgi:hypothetical protein